MWPGNYKADFLDRSAAVAYKFEAGSFPLLPFLRLGQKLNEGQSSFWRSVVCRDGGAIDDESLQCRRKHSDYGDPLDRLDFADEVKSEIRLAIRYQFPTSTDRARVNYFVLHSVGDAQLC